MRYFMQRGIPEWDATEDYPANARVQDGGTIYRARLTNINKQPSANPTEWTPEGGNLGGIVSLVVNTTLTAFHCGKLIHAGGTGVTLNIPQANTVPEGSVIKFVNVNPVTTVSLSRQGSDTFWLGGAGTATNLALEGGDTLTLVSNAANNRWYVLDRVGALGQYQAWQDVSGSRAVGTTYTNTTARPIALAIGCTPTGNIGFYSIVVDGATATSQNFTVSQASVIYAIVPPGKTYSFNKGGADTTTVLVWREFR